MESYLIIIMEYCHARLPEAHEILQESVVRERVNNRNEKPTLLIIDAQSVKK